MRSTKYKLKDWVVELTDYSSHGDCAFEINIFQNGPKFRFIHKSFMAKVDQRKARFTKDLNVAKFI